MDLTTDPKPHPTPAAKVVRLARRRPRPEGHLDLTDDEDPTDAASIEVTRNPVAEASSLAFEFRIWKALALSFRYSVHGPAAWAAPLCAVVLADAIVVLSIAPNLILSSAAPTWARVALAASLGGMVLITGSAVLLYLMRRKP
jgi:hypothetical protein